MKIFVKKAFYFLTLVLLAGSIFSVVYGQMDILGGATPTVNNAAKKIDFLADWSAQTFVPADYQGKPLPTFQSIVALSATPIVANGQKVNEGSYTFNWIVDNSIAVSPTDGSAKFKVSEGAGSEHEVQLRVFDADRNIIAEYFFSIPVSKSDIIVYKTNGEGSLDNISGTIFVNAGSELNLVAKPYFFNNISDEASLDYIWKLNDKVIKHNIIDPNKVSIDFPSEILSGTQYDLKLEAENPNDLYQSIEKNYIIKVR